MAAIISGSNLTAIRPVFFSLLVIAGKITQIYVDYQILFMLSMISIAMISYCRKEAAVERFIRDHKRKSA
jgi:hypothetical protein